MEHEQRRASANGEGRRSSRLDSRPAKEHERTQEHALKKQQLIFTYTNKTYIFQDGSLISAEQKVQAVSDRGFGLAPAACYHATKLPKTRHWAPEL